MSTQNVIPITQSKGAGPMMSSEASSIVRNCRASIQRDLEPLVQRMFTNADDILFEYANRGQATYFDAMRELRIRRREMEDTIRQSLEQAYRKFERGAAAEGGRGELSLDSLALVDENELEESLAITGMAEKARNSFGQDLSGLEARLAHLRETEDLKGDQNPFGPEVIARACKEAAGLIHTTLEVKLVIFKLFERAVMAQLGSIYREANLQLLEAGVLPRLKVQGSSGGSSHRSAASRAPGEGGGAGSGGAGGQGGGGGGGGAVAPTAAEEAGIIGMLHDLLTQARGVTGWAPLPIAPAGAAVDAGGLMQTLSTMQLGGFSAVDAEAEMPQGVDLRHALGAALGKQNMMIGTREADVIDLVSMLFEFILDDESLPDSVKALLGRLQIPYIKVALLDLEFFAKKSHPARRLLNDLARAGLAVDAEGHKGEINPRLAKIRSIVERVVADFKENVELFEALIQELADFLEMEALTEKKAAEATLEEHRKREKRERTRIEVDGLLNSSLRELSAPEPIMDILRGAWLEVLIETRVQDGEGALWRERFGFIDELVWSVRPRRSQAERQVLAKNLPKLLRRLAQGLDAIGYSMDDRKVILKTLEPFHLACLRGEVLPVPKKEPEKPVQAPAQTPKPAPQAASPASVSQHSAPPAAQPAQASQTTQPSQPSQAGKAAQPAQPAQPAAGADKPKGGFDSVIADLEAQLAGLSKLEAMLSEEPDLPKEEAGAEFAGMAEEEPLPEDEFTDMARGLRVGTWVEFMETAGPRRAKLAWKSDLLGDFTFVNWKFQVVAERTLATMANDLRNGLAKIIEDVPVLERALDSVVQRLRRGIAPA